MSWSAGSSWPARRSASRSTRRSTRCSPRSSASTTLDTGARARCDLQGGPAVPIVARRYTNPPGPGSGFVDHLATAASSGSGVVDTSNPRGYDVRTPASEAAPGPQFTIYGPSSKAHNDSSFRGFIGLDVRNFENASSRVYYNGVTAGMNPNTIKDVEGAYLVTGIPRSGVPVGLDAAERRRRRSPSCPATTHPSSRRSSTTRSAPVTA